MRLLLLARLRHGQPCVLPQRVETRDRRRFKPGQRKRPCRRRGGELTPPAPEDFAPRPRGTHAHETFAGEPCRASPGAESREGMIMRAKHREAP